MAEFALIASVLGCVDICCRVYSTLDRFVGEAQHADSTAADLRSRVGELREMVSSVKLSLESRQRQGRTVHEEEQHYLDQIHASVKRSHQTLERFKAELDGLHGDSRFRVLQQALLAIRLQRIDTVVERFNQNVQTHIQTMTIHFMCLQTYMHSVVGYLLETIIQDVDRFPHLQVGQRHLPQDHLLGGRQPLLALENGSTNEDKDIIRNLRETVNTARSVVDRAWNPPSEGVQPQDTLPRRPNSYASTVESTHTLERESEDDPDPSFKAATPLEILLPLIDNLSKRVSHAQSARDYRRAEIYQLEKIECLEERRITYNFWFDKVEAQETLANIYHGQSNRAEEERIINNLIRSDRARDMEIEEESPPLEEPIESFEKLRRLSGYYYRLAKSRLERSPDPRASSFLERSVEYAKRAVTLLRRTLRDPTQPGPDFVRTVQLLVRALEFQGKEVAVETYKQVYLGEREPAPTIHDGPMLEPIILLPEIIDRPDDTGNTPLVSAIMRGECERVVYLLRQGADAGKLCLGKPPLIHAVKKGDPFIVRVLKRYRPDLDLEWRDPEGKTALATAAYGGNEGMIEALVDAGAKLEAAAFGGVTPLMQAACNGHAGAADVLIMKGANCHATSDVGWNVLHYAVYGPGGSRLVQRLIGCNIDVDASCLTSGQTPLHMAVDKFGSTAFLDKVKLHGEDAARKEALRVLLENADVTAEDNSGNTPLSLSVEHGNEGLAKKLIDKGATYNGRLPPNVSDYMLRILNSGRVGKPLKRISTGKSIRKLVVGKK